MQSNKDGVYGEVENLDFRKVLEQLQNKEIDGFEVVTSQEFDEAKSREGMSVLSRKLTRAQKKRVKAKF